MKKLLLLAVLLCGFSHSHAGEIYLVLFKGNAFSIKDKKTDKIYPCSKYRLLPEMRVSFSKNPVFIIYSTDNKYVDHFKSYENPINYGDIEGSLKSIPSPGFIEVMNSYHELREANLNTRATVKLGSKGLNSKAEKLKELDEYVFPEDSIKITSNRVTFDWKFRQKLLGGVLRVTRSVNGAEILSKSIGDSGTETLILQADGWYDWEIVSSDENKIIESNSFVKLTPAEAKKELSQLENFKKSLADLQKETQEILIESYCEQHQLEY